MPSLTVCNRRTPFAGDDLQFLCLNAVLFRLLQLALAISLLIYSSIQNDHVKVALNDIVLECEVDEDLSPMASHGLRLMYVHCSVSMVLALLGLATALPMYLISLRGTPTDSKPRTALVPLCLFNFSVLNLFRVAGLIFGLYATNLLHEYCTCVEDTIHYDIDLPNDACPEEAAWSGVVVALNVTHLIDVIMTAIQFLYFSALCKTCTAVVPSEFGWKACVTCCVGCSSMLTCCLFGGFDALNGDLGDLAVVMSDYTNNNGELDITISDIAAGLVMVNRSRRRRMLEARDRIRRESFDEFGIELQLSEGVSGSNDSTKNDYDELRTTSAISFPNLRSSSHLSANTGSSTREVLSARVPGEQMYLAEAARYMPMAQASYSWVQYLFQYPKTGIFRLVYLMATRCTCFSRPPKDRVVGDWPWGPHQIALEQLSGLPAEDIVFSSFKQSIEAVPYMIAVDREWQSIVISIRGTLSMESVFADLSLRPVELAAVGQEYGFDGQGKYCHNGILRSSLWICADILRRGKLKTLVEREYRDYRLRITGHSLGGGCAAMVSLLLRSSFPNISCLAFSVPGSVFSENLAEECNSWLTSYIIDADIVPRLSVQSFEDLRDDVLRMICRIKVSKKELWKIVGRKSKDRKVLMDEDEYILCQPDEIIESPFKHQVDKFLEFQTLLKGRSEGNVNAALYPPGRIIQLVRTKTESERSGHNTKKDYVARWIQRSELQYILLSSHLFTDHEPSSVNAKIQHTAQTKYKLNAPLYKVLDHDESQ